MNKYLGLMLVLAGVLLAGCSAQRGDYSAASSLSKDGYARNAAEARKLDGQEAKLWGFVDHGNLYGDESAKQILGERWGGDGPSATTWRFNLTAKADDESERPWPAEIKKGR